MENLTPQQIVAELDRYIIGQGKAKKSVAVALRNRYRRSLLPIEAQEEITPKLRDGWRNWLKRLSLK